MGSRRKVIYIVCAVVVALGVMLPTFEGSPVPALVGVPIAVVALLVLAATAAADRSSRNGKKLK